MGILYFFTFGIFGIGWFIDLFTLGNQVDIYNALHGRGANRNRNVNNVVVNVSNTNPMAQAVHSVNDQLVKLHDLKKAGALTEEEFTSQKAKLLNS